ncbi:MAG: carboxylating nicotinate-nucleotide diphosphorylase [Negativicutes bacterium]|nr:carboxylating nicotinate-nucleotide diphosphorylase [Negativicutes bacterium]
MQNSRQLDELLFLALEEDIGHGDITTNATVAPERWARANVIAKAEGIVCGLFVMQRIFFLLDPQIQCTFCLNEGDPISKGTILAKISGPAGSILSGERVALNFLQHLSGIATRTRAAVLQVQGTKTKIVDTRKTMPGLRWVEKYAVQIGGALNHRYNLADGVLIKDNHIAAAGGIAPAIAGVRRQVPHLMKIEIEVENMLQLTEALQGGAEVILLDNMSAAEMAEAVQVVAGRALTEASGNMGEKDLREIAATGVDFISIGALTHSVKALDISLRFVNEA